MASDAQAPAPSSVYQLRVVLAGISPLIWRRLLVTDQTSVAEHLHRFTIHGVGYGIARPGTAGFAHDARRVLLADFGFRVGERFVYEYDFFDAWRHDLRVEKILPADPGRRYPVCVDGARTAPPEDCGGPAAFLALRQTYSTYAVATRMADLLAPLLTADGDDLVGEHLAGRREELATLLAWSRIDHFDRAAVNHALHTDPALGGSPP
ncbi:plasmid pRiA4b ORF-3 family protein [Frankia sp. CNm7]|uniref:Plasmid pRiA4b ORF-3 family protein n=1 Tax=Frankia nepalensis TaxID=1836974 RepID=A0A937RAE6_9ACTN|nr:plasmid pRiA4b ORF-3 family protein [Frankia nepalensis]MBL7496985.1 plasmid pRiA4b ORF-3 family protein [Frankia nepalensis]MBL7511314.1 plasmid pRiA4b ORF-3 family protein [Frankia nepalensis]MBL7523602.1 plasmid pRiA4b ORF-3 family protein [Frankia nepalensis]MBL7626082.1 plasmid pRiA4b ORF-3 family protein [Frankia nepalensis]